MDGSWMDGLNIKVCLMGQQDRSAPTDWKWENWDNTRIESSRLSVRQAAAALILLLCVLCCEAADEIISWICWLCAAILSSSYVQMCFLLFCVKENFSLRKISWLCRFLIPHGQKNNAHWWKYLAWALIFILLIKQSFIHWKIDSIVFYVFLRKTCLRITPNTIRKGMKSNTQSEISAQLSKKKTNGFHWSLHQ